MDSKVPKAAAEAVLVESEDMSETGVRVQGYDFARGPVDYDALLSSFATTGFQATNLGRAIEEVNRMLAWRLSDEPVRPDDTIQDPEKRNNVKATIFLGYTSNLISSGTREAIRFLCQHKLVDCVVSTAGGVEEDFIKCLAPTYLGAFELSGANLRTRGINRIGNLLVPNKNYCLFEDWLIPILDRMLEEQKNQGTLWTPSRIIHRLGLEIDNEESVYYWCAKNKIPVFCPAITDGSIGDMVFFHSYRNPGLVIDIAKDLRAINDISLQAAHTGMIILGGGLVKHHINNANLMRNGADFCVYVNTAQEFDGSDAGARPDEAISWGKIKIEAHPVKVYGEATIIFPLLVAQTFAKLVHKS